MSELQRITSEYVETEDRLRITGELGANETEVLWLSQRLLLRLLPHLFAWLEKQSGDGLPVDIVQSFAQEAAKLDLKSEAPVENIHNATGWLVDAVDIRHDLEVLTIRFRGGAQQEVILTTNTIALRQWLVILQALWSKAEWPVAIWPGWITESSATENDGIKLSLH